MAREGGTSRRWTGALAALVVSALVHTGFVLVVKEAPVVRPPRPPSQPITITFDSRPVSDNAVMVDDPDARISRPKTRNPNAVTLPEPKDNPRPDGQVVKLPPPKKKERPDQAKFLSEQDHKAEKEEKSKKTSNDASAAEKFKKENHANADEDEAAKKQAEEQRPSLDERMAGRRKLRLSLFGDSSAPPPPGALAGMWRYSAPGEGGEGAESGEDTEERDDDGAADDDQAGGGTRGKSLSLSDEAASRIAGGAPANDALPDEIPEGSGVFLNARQWKYATFFNRLSDAVRRQWRPNDVLRRREHDRSISAARRRQTVVEVTLDRAGKVVRVRVERLSGADPLDEEAVRAMRAAGPFANPPSGLFEGKDDFTFRFGFQVNFEDGPNFFRVPGFGGY